MTRFPDLAIFEVTVRQTNKQTDRNDYFTPCCACAHGVTTIGLSGHSQIAQAHKCIPKISKPKVAASIACGAQRDGK
jgi:hypothetical protein